MQSLVDGSLAAEGAGAGSVDGEANWGLNPCDNLFGVEASGIMMGESNKSRGFISISDSRILDRSLRRP